MNNMLAVIARELNLGTMNSKHRKTLAAVFTDPVSGTIEWAAVDVPPPAASPVRCACRSCQ